MIVGTVMLNSPSVEVVEHRSEERVGVEAVRRHHRHHDRQVLQ